MSEIVANDTLKRSCEKCTKSKVKCEYGSSGCKRCVAKGFICVYRPKRKRGPQDKRSKALKRAKESSGEVNDDSFYSAVSSYERRVWSVFFTIFKHHQRLDSSTWAWCWFAQQLNKVRLHLEVTGNTNSLKMLSTWLEALKLDVLSVSNQYRQQCKFNPSLCSSCSALALNAPNKTGELYKSLPGIPIMSEFEDKTESEEELGVPKLECFNTGMGSHSVIVNEAFTREFGFTGAEMNAMLDWSGGGFLPWGGDLLARLCVKETDLHEFLQILALKFKSLGSPESKNDGIYEDVSRRVPSVHIFQLWTTDEHGKINSTQNFYLRCMHRECIQKNRMSTQMQIVFKSVGRKMKDTAGQKPVDMDAPKAPVVSSKAPSKPVKKEIKVELPVEACEEHAPLLHHVQSGGISAAELQQVDRVPKDLQDMYDWSDDVTYINTPDYELSVPMGNSSTDLDEYIVENAPPQSVTDADLSFLDALMPQESTHNIISPVVSNANTGSPLDAFCGTYTDPNHSEGWRSIFVRAGQLMVEGCDGPGFPRWETTTNFSILNPNLIEADFSVTNGPKNLGAQLQTNGDLKWFDGNVWTRKS